MKQKKLANELRDMYYDAPEGERVAHIVLFGIIYAAELEAAEQAGCSIRKIMKKSGLKKSQKFEENTYISQIKNGMKLAKYVKYVKPKK